LLHAENENHPTRNILSKTEKWPEASILVGYREACSNATEILKISLPMKFLTDKKNFNTRRYRARIIGLQLGLGPEPDPLQVVFF
jgi:hypothetical protein